MEIGSTMIYCIFGFILLWVLVSITYVVQNATKSDQPHGFLLLPAKTLTKIFEWLI